MRKRLISGVCGAAVVGLLSGSVLAQTTDFMKQEAPDAWRASKLPGVAVYGPDQKKVGDVTDVLMDHDGKATGIVIGVGGFLGMGQKDVAVPFDQVKFTDQPMANSPGMATAPNAAPAGSTVAAAPGLGTPAASNGSAIAPAAPGMGTTATPAADVAPAHNPSTAYPDHGTIDLTADQLKAAPSFQFAK